MTLSAIAAAVANTCSRLSRQFDRQCAQQVHFGHQRVRIADVHEKVGLKRLIARRVSIGAPLDVLDNRVDMQSQDSGRIKQKRRTRSAVLQAAIVLMKDGATPAVAEAADVSRRTAYRYFSSQEQLLTEAVLETLRPEMQSVVEATDNSEDAEARLQALVNAVWVNALSYESLLRTMIRLTVERQGDHETGEGEGHQPRRGYRRIDWIEMALAPLHDRLDEPRFERLVSALSLCMGIEALLVLRDIRGLSEVQAEEVSQWAARSMLRATVEEWE